jgi:hypothetical protein
MEMEKPVYVHVCVCVCVLVILPRREEWRLIHSFTQQTLHEWVHEHRRAKKRKSQPRKS